MDAVRGLELVPRPAPHVLDRYGYLAGQDRDRAADINQFFADPTVAALLPIRGDWGSARILPYLDYDLIRQNPKIIVGFSDLTALLLGITAQTGLVTFHGPNGFTAWRPNQTEPFQQVLFEGQALTFENSVAPEDRDRLMQVKFRIHTITPGQARGRLYGGNLSVLSGIVGSPYLPDFNGAILFLEDVGEPIYRIDRMLTQLKLAGILDKLAGFVFGQCTNCGPSSGYGALTLEEVLQDHIAPLGIPAWANAMIGHVEPIVTVPLGVEVAIDAERGRIQMLDAAIA
jgi:muramoyltetrapeptide carboxypeptidase